MSGANEVKADRRYTKDHEWARESDGGLQVGVTAYAVGQLGDITLVTFDVAPGDEVVAGKPFGTIESVKTLSDLFAPVSGTVKKLNEKLESQPELINDDCWGDGWMIEITPSSPADVSELLDVAAYTQHLESSDH